MRHTPVLDMVLFLVLFVTLVLPGANAQGYVPRDVTLQDNAYNVTAEPRLQWWYLDAIFTNGFSAHAGIMTVGVRGVHGFYILQLQVYQDGLLRDQARRILPLSRIEAATDVLNLRYAGDPFIEGYLTHDGRMAVNVHLEFYDLAATLTFIGQTKGWKGATPHGMWGCPLPKAAVSGTLLVGGETYEVQGIGYQEHGWDVQRLHRSWTWAKFSTDTTNVIFSQAMKNRHEEDIFIVMVNVGSDQYISVDRENVTFTIDEFRWDHGRPILSTATFTVDQGTLHISATLKPWAVDFKSIVLMNYWRLHAKITGTVTDGVLFETIDDLQIMEIFRFP